MRAALVTGALAVLAGCWRGAAPAPSVAPAPVEPAPRALPRRAPPALFTVTEDVIGPGDAVELRFPAPLRAADGERYWITIVPDGTPDERWADWAYVPDGATAATLPVPGSPGRYEVRLHGNYPTRTTNVIERALVEVR